jgi:DNA polymerase-1
VNRLIIIDGNAILHRAFHALPPLTAPDGTLVNAVYGFTSMLLRLVTDLTPTHIAVTFDRPAPTFRKILYADYQIKRPKMDDGLAQQIPLVHDVVKAMKVPIYEQDGFEADDLIGSLCKIYTKKMDQIIIVTGDKDLLQLATDTTKIYMPTKGLSEAKLYGPKETKERLGVSPKQIPDYKALAGDQSDNYPGVPGIGPKTAVDLLTTNTTIEKLYKNIHADTNMSAGTKEKLLGNQDLAILSKTLATIKQDIPMKVIIKPLDKTQFSTDAVVSILQRFGFHSLIKRIQTPVGTEKAAVKKKKEERKKDIDEQMSLI